MTIKTIIIDDEAPARALLRIYLAGQGNIEVVGEFTNGFEGIKAINALKPDLVILDIQMPKINGFEMLELLEHHPVIIFSTAYNEFAIKAFELNAVDYLLKPYSKKRLLGAIAKAEVRLKIDVESRELPNLLAGVNDLNNEYLQRIVVKTGAKIEVIPIDEVMYLEANDDYVNIYVTGGKFIKQRTMKYYEQRLPPSKFVRIHRSFIVNIEEINKLELMEKDAYVVILKNNSRLKVSRSGYPKLKRALRF